MATILFWLAIATLVLTVATTVQGVRGERQIHDLHQTPPDESDRLPAVSIIVAARNEERDLEEALTSLLALDYPDWELMVVDDRSTDGTGEILARLAAANPHLTTARVDELPAGWLGKNHALDFGARRARGEYLLFTDADIVMQPDTLRRAMRYVREHNLDHLAMAPEIRRVSPLLDAYVVTFIIFFFFYYRPWKARDPRSRAAVGIGAFNLVRAATYRAAGGHERIRMRPDDDVKLGQLMKRHGGRCDIVFGGDLIYVRWYASVAELVDGLMKNTYAGVEYNLLVAVWAVATMLLLNVWPYVALLLAAIQGWWAVAGLNLAIVAIQWAGFMHYARGMRVPIHYAVLMPLTVLLQIYIVSRAVILTYVQGGIRWRGTFYRLAELKANRL